MCDPVSIALAVVPKLISTIFENQAANDVSKARASVVNQTTNDINKYRATARNQYNQSLNSATPQSIQQGMDQATAQRGADYEAAVKDPQNIVSPNASGAAIRSISSALAKGQQFSRDQALRKAATEAYGAAGLNRDLVMDEAGAKIGVQGDFARGREQVANLQLENANHAGDGAARMAGLVDAAGDVAGAAYGPISGEAPGYDVSSGIRWNTARQGIRYPTVTPAFDYNQYYG